MDNLIFDQLTAAIERRGGAFPCIKSPVLQDLLSAIFSEEEARLAIMMPDLPVTAEEMADRMKMDMEIVHKTLETMAKKGILFAVQNGAKQIYVRLPLIPGILENQVIKGEVNERVRKISQLTVEYLSLLKELEKNESELLPKVPFGRVIAVEQDIPADITVQTYDRLLAYIDKIETFAQVACHCRHVGELTGNPCSKPKDVCLAVGPGAKYMVEYGLGKAISREEARHVLKRAEDAGLVHVVSNTGKNIDFICNCCLCHCDNLQAFKRFADYGRAAKSSFVARVQADDCVGCGNCLERCPMDALSMDDDLASVDKKSCIGCGLCVSVCPSAAIALLSREDAPVPYTDIRQLNKAIMSSKKSANPANQ
jgi:ferredoxin